MTDEPRRRALPLPIRTAAGLCRLLLRLTARVTVEVDGEVPTKGPLIVVANHISFADPPLVAGWLTSLLGRQMHILAKQGLFVPVIGFILRWLGATPVKSGGSDIEAYRTARNLLERGEVLCIFPEGTRSWDGAMAEPKPGVAMLATRHRVPILPVGISGTDMLLGRGRKLPGLRTRVKLHIGSPFTLTLDAALSHRAATNAASDELMRRIAALVDERHRGRFGAGGL